MSDVKRLCIVPCGSAKIWDKEPQAGPTQAQNVYTGIFAVACQRYAKAFFHNWVILSAKHGFLFPDDTINETYNVSFISPSDETIGIQALREQAAKKGLYEYQEITVLGGKHYVERVKAVFDQGQKIILPLSDCKGIGYMLQKLTNALEAKNPMEKGDVIKKSVMEKGTKKPQNPQLIGKYTPLYEYLGNHEGAYLELHVEQLEAILGFRLPDSAFRHRAWWSNDIKHSQAKAWLFADWEVDKVALPAIVFRRKSDE